MSVSVYFPARLSLPLTVRSSPGDKSKRGIESLASTGDEAPSLKLSVLASKTGRKETRVCRSSSSSSCRVSGESDKRESGRRGGSEMEAGRELGREESSLPFRRDESIA